MNSVVRVALGCALAASSAVLLTWAFAPYDAWFLIWIGFVPMVVAEHRILPPRFSGLALAIGVGGFTAGCFGGVFPAQAAWYMKMLPLLVGLAVFATSRGERARYARSNYLDWPMRAARSWVALELLRTFVPALGTWGLVGYSMYRQPWFLQPVAAVGMFGLDLLIVVVNYALAMLVIGALDRRGFGDGGQSLSLRRGVQWCAAALLAVIAWSATSLMMRPRADTTVRVAALQPGVRPGQFGDTVEARDRGILGVLEAATQRATAEGARVVVWPEGALGRDPELAYHDELANLARASGAYLFVGYKFFTPGGARNEVQTISPAGEFLGAYGKDHPVLFLGGSSVTRGQYPTHPTAFGTVGAIICADIDFTDTSREMALRGAKVIAVPSADWAEIAPKHYVNAVFRALETRATVIKSEFSRDSAIVDGAGAMAATAVTSAPTAAVLVADVGLYAGIPLAARLGDWVGWLCVGGLILEAFTTRFVRTRAIT